MRGLITCDPESIEEFFVEDGISQPPHPFSKLLRQPVHHGGDTSKPIGAVVNAVHSRHDGKKDLRRTDVRRGLFAADVLLPGLESHAQRRLAARIDRGADDASRDGSFELILCREKCRVGSTESHGDTESLRAADRDIGAELARRGQERQCQQVRRDDDMSA